MHKSLTVLPHTGQLSYPISTANKANLVMDQLLSKAGSTLVTFAVRSSVQVASSYVIKSVGTLMDKVPHNERKKLDRKREMLQNKIETVTYSIGVIQLMAARGNSNLDSVLRLADYLKEDIDEFTKDITRFTSGNPNKQLSSETIKLIEKMIDELVEKIDKIVPVLNLVLTTYGASSVSNFQDYVSPGRLLNATVLVNKSNDELKGMAEGKRSPVGPQFSLTFYNIYYNPNTESHITWREKYARCKFQIFRKHHPEMEYYYELEVEEDFDDERYHDTEESPGSITYDIRQIAKLFFSASGRLLKLEDKSTPVLVFKMRDDLIESQEREDVVSAEESQSETGVEWIAFGDYETPDNTSSDEDEDGEEEDDDENDAGGSNQIKVVESKAIETTKPQKNTGSGSPLALLEYLIRLCTLQANDQTPLLEVKDERLRLYLSDENYMQNVSNKLTTLNKKMEELKI